MGTASTESATHSTGRISENIDGKNEQDPMISTFSLNIQGMDPGIKNQRWKVRALDEEVNSSEFFIPFFSLTETHLKSYHHDAEIQIRNYVPFRGDRQKRLQGGTMLYLHNSLVADDESSFSNSFCDCVMIYNAQANMVISV